LLAARRAVDATANHPSADNCPKERTVSPVVATLVVLAAVLPLIGIAVIISYNRFVIQRNLVVESWSQVDVELARRHDLIPNLVDTVKRYAAHERQVVAAVTEARTSATHARAHDGNDRHKRAVAENALTRAVAAIVTVAENYPQLRASENFLGLQHQLVNTEDRIAAGRRFHNGNVRALNTRVESVPSALVARAFGFTRASYFPLDDPSVRHTVPVDFGSAAQ
jgi:LemA protein